MKHLLNVLYVTTPHSELYCRNQTVCLSIGGKEKLSISSTLIDSIVCFGVMAVTTPFLDFCSKNGISVTLLSEYGRFCGRFNGPTTGSVYLRNKQHLQFTDETARVYTGRNIVGAKLKNTKTFLSRAARDNPDAGEQLLEAVSIIETQMNGVRSSRSLEELRGYEGVAASAYFQRLDLLLKNKDIYFSFDGRNRRPPQDPVNAALSFTYTLLTREYVSALESFGIDPQVGVVHGMRAGRPALALDLMEELRVPLCDRLVLSLINLRRLQRNAFEERIDSTLLNEKGRRILLQAWQERKEEEIIHPFLKESVKIGLIPFVQAQLYGKYIRGELDAYPPFLWR